MHTKHCDKSNEYSIKKYCNWSGNSEFWAGSTITTPTIWNKQVYTTSIRQKKTFFFKFTQQNIKLFPFTLHNTNSNMFFQHND